MGAFVLGILVGWLAEWLFFTFWIKGKSTGNFADCTALKNELSAKNIEIATLKSDLDKTKKTVSNPNEVSKASEKEDAKKSVASSSTSKKSSASEVANRATKTTKESVAAATITTAKTKATTKSVATKSAPTKKAPVKKASEKTASTKKSPAKKTPAKSSTTKAKAIPAAKKTVAKKAPSKKKTSGDDLTKLSGIGPSMAATLNEIGITSYKELAGMDDDILRDMLEASGARLNNNKEAMDTWNEQASLADKGDMVSLKKLQDSLKR